MQTSTISFRLHSLTILLLLFLASFLLHFYGSLKDENEQLVQKGLALESASDYIGNLRFWFESFRTGRENSFPSVTKSDGFSTIKTC